MLEFIPFKAFPVALILVSCAGFVINIRGFMKAAHMKKYLSERGKLEEHEPYPMFLSPVIYSGVIIFSVYVLNIMKGW